jgi:hypothetical protein
MASFIVGPDFLWGIETENEGGIYHETEPLHPSHWRVGIFFYRRPAGKRYGFLLRQRRILPRKPHLRLSADPG